MTSGVLINWKGLPVTWEEEERAWYTIEGGRCHQVLKAWIDVDSEVKEKRGETE